ncbi:MAG: PIG-L family deacetylase [Acidobacteria bacterium]|nr:PIG-L family deacetylase [Acidobacteriota bacterium]
MRVFGFSFLFAAWFLAEPSSQSIPHDSGAAGTWHRIQKLRTTASVMHTTAHPDDEHGGVITKLSRKDGARLALLTLNRGESGDNAIGSQLFDGLGLIRTEELVVADRYYGVDDQYFTTVIDYGFSKRLEEAFEKWGREQVLRDVVRIIRINRPWVLLSRFQGNERDGHGNHQTAGLITQLAFKAAGDAAQYPEQLKEGLRPWQPFKIYIGGVRENEKWSLRVDSGEYSPWLGDSYDNVARYGLSFQRSQTSGRFNPGAGQNFGYYSRVGTRVQSTDREESIFDGIDTSLAGLPKTIGWQAPASVPEALAGIDAAAKKAADTFTMIDPSTAVPALVDGLQLTRETIGKSAGAEEALFVLRIKERQFQEAINAALGLQLVATAQPADLPDPAGPFAAFAPPPAMAAPVPGQTFEVRVRLANRSGARLVGGSTVSIETAPGWTASPAGPVSGVAGGIGPGAGPQQSVQMHRFTVTVADDVAISTKPYFTRSRIQESRYTLLDPSQFGRAASAPPLVAVARYGVAGQPVEIRETVKRRESKLPYGEVLREVRSVPRLALTVSPTSAVVPLEGSAREVDLQVDLVHNAESPTTGTLGVTLPQGWTAEPRDQPFSFARAGERATFRVRVRPASLDAKTYPVEVVARAAGKEYREGYELIDERDLEARHLYRASAADVKGVDVTVLPNLEVGYVMGVGDQVPLGLQQLGVQVTLLGEDDLATADLTRFDAVMTGTRAYAVREDLRTYNQRLLDYVKAGGNMIVLYNTQELVPAKFAPFPADLPRNAEEVSEEDSAVEILAPTHQVFMWPNQITKADFEGWVEQRGSKFFTTWDAAYAPMIATFDKGQAPQRGGWLVARHGKGTWTYFAYALHRQLPYGVPGAYRIVANLLALGKTPDRR